MGKFSNLPITVRSMIMNALKIEIDRATAYSNKCLERKMFNTVSTTLIKRVRIIQDGMFEDKLTEDLVDQILFIPSMSDCPENICNLLWTEVGK